MGLESQGLLGFAIHVCRPGEGFMTKIGHLGYIHSGTTSIPGIACFGISHIVRMILWNGLRLLNPKPTLRLRALSYGVIAGLSLNH